MVTRVGHWPFQSRRSYPPDVAIPAASLCLMLFVCFLWPSLGSVPDPLAGSILDANQPLLSDEHFLGTDQNGRDVWSRLLHGGKSSIRIAVTVNLLGLVVGGLIGCFSGLVGGLVDSVVMRVVDILIAFPSLVLAITLAQVLGPSEANTIWALTFYSVPAFARVGRAETLRLRERPFMLAAELAGSSGLRALTRHIVPHLLPQLVEFGLLGVGVVIVIEGALSFLGLGIQPPEPSWGNMIFQGQHSILVKPSLVLLPGAFLLVTVLSFNLLGRALHRTWNGR